MSDDKATATNESRPAVGAPVEQPVRPWERCREHGTPQPRVWACPTCLVELRRWKSTHAPRLDALEGLLCAAQAEAEAGREAVATLAGERAANALLTDEVERLRAALQDYFAAADAAWLELCHEAAKQGMKSMPILPGQAKALDKYNELRVVFGPNARVTGPQQREKNHDD